MIKHLQNALIKRQTNLVIYLKNNTDRLPLIMQHKIYGSVKELENINNLLKEIHKKSSSKVI